MNKINASELIGLRRSLMNLASLMLLMVLTTGIAGLFAAWSLSEFHLRIERTLTEAAVAVDDARSVNSNFKAQVQEWKNILLRGHDVKDRERYVAAFRAQGQKTVDLLESLPAKVDRLKLMTDVGQQVVPFRLGDAVDVPMMLTELRVLHERYERALAAASSGDAMDGWDPMLADGLVRGADRAVSESVDSIPFAVIRAVNATLRVSQEEGAARFETLSRFVWSAIVFALAMVAIMVWRILRHPALVR